MIARHDQAIRKAIGTLDKISDWLGSDWTYGNLAIVCGLDYASYRAPQFDWRKAHPKLAAWHAALTDDPVWRDTYAYETMA